MKSDRQIRQNVVDELKWDPSINERAIGVAVKDGIVTLAGTVENYAQKLNAERAAERVTDVRALVDSLNVVLPTRFGRSDAEIAAAARNAEPATTSPARPRARTPDRPHETALHRCLRRPRAGRPGTRN